MELEGESIPLLHSAHLMDLQSSSVAEYFRSTLITHTALGLPMYSKLAAGRVG